jgi:cytochrome oxidase Cu insertion factor (SCO1/SenC/PrrC family)
MNEKRFILCATLFAALLVSCVQPEFADPAEALKETAPGFTLQTFDNRVIRLDDLKGKAVVVWFMASW